MGLEYDNSAFYYFALSMLSFYVVPSWVIILRRVHKALFAKDQEIGAIARTSAEKVKAEKIKKNTRGIGVLLSSPQFIFNVVITLILSGVCVYLVSQLSSNSEINTFDPFSILEIDSNAEKKEIKKAYKKKSLMYHPDKNPGNSAAEAMFIKVAKAYEALTDETARENWEKYGNPDGKQNLEVSIGLPTLLLDTSNRNIILLVYLLIMVVLIPLAVYKYYSDSSKYGEKDVMYDTYSWFHHSLNEHTMAKSIPETFAGSAEFREKNMPKSDSEREEISSIMSTVRSHMQKPKINHPILMKGNVLVHSYLLRKTDNLSPQAMEDLNYMLRFSNSLTEAMISICQHQDWLKCAVNCINFGQYMSQAMWIKDSELLQLPHFTQTEVKHCEKGKGATTAKTIKQYLEIPDENKKGLADMSVEQKADVIKCCSLIPDIGVETKVFTDDDEDAGVYEGDLVSVQVTITRKHLQEGKKAGLVHSPFFPFPKNEAWWVIMGTKEGKIISVEKVIDPSRVVEHKIKFLAPRQGNYEFDLWVKSNAYVGLDQKQTVKLTSLDPSTLPEFVVHPDDAELDDEPTLFEEMLNANVEEDSDSDDDDSDDDDDNNKKGDGIRELSAAERKKEQLRLARKKAAAAAGDDDSDDDSDVEEVYTDDKKKL